MCVYVYNVEGVMCVWVSGWVRLSCLFFHYMGMKLRSSDLITHTSTHWDILLGPEAVIQSIPLYWTCREGLASLNLIFWFRIWNLSCKVRLECWVRTSPRRQNSAVRRSRCRLLGLFCTATSDTVTLSFAQRLTLFLQLPPLPCPPPCPPGPGPRVGECCGPCVKIFFWLTEKTALETVVHSWP